MAGGGDRSPWLYPVASFPVSDVFPRTPGSSLCLHVTSRFGKWRRALNAPQECPSQEPCGEVFCKVESPFVRRIIVLRSPVEVQCVRRLSGERDLFEGRLAHLLPMPNARASPSSDGKRPVNPSMMGNSPAPRMDQSIFGQLCLLEMETYPELKKKSLCESISLSLACLHSI